MRVPQNSGGHIAILAGLFAAMATAQVAPVTALSPTVLQSATGVTIDTGGLGSARITYAGSSGFLFMEFPTPSLPVIPCASGGGTCLAPVDVRVRHTLNGFRQVSILVDQRCQGPTGFGFVSSDNFPCLVSPRLDAQNQVSVAALVTLQRNVGDPTVTVNILFNWQVALPNACPAADAPSNARSIVRIADESCPITDLAIDHIEIVQSIQTDTGAAPLIRNRRSVLRVFVTSVGPNAKPIPYGKIGALVTANGRELESLEPFSTVLAPPKAQLRLWDWRHSFNYILPADIAERPTIDVSAHVFMSSSANDPDNNNRAFKTFQLTRPNLPDPFRIGRITVCSPSKQQPLRTCPSGILPKERQHLAAWLPTTKVEFYDLPLPRYKIDDPNFFDDPEATLLFMQALVLDYLKLREIGEVFSFLAQPLPDQIVIQVAGNYFSNPSAETHFANGGLGNVWLIRHSGYGTQPNETVDDPTLSDLPLLVAHGIGHNLGLVHYSGLDGSPLDVRLGDFAGWNHDDDPRYTSWEAPGPVESGQSLNHSLMNQFVGVSHTWVSAGEFKALHERAPALYPAPTAASPLRAAGEGDTLVISGSVTRDGLTGALDPGFHGPAKVAAPRSDPAGDTCLRFQPGGASHCFNAKFVDNVNRAYFAVAAALPAGTTRVTLAHKGRDLTSLNTGTPPQVAIVSPAGGETWQGLQKVRWTAPGDSPMVFDVQYSSDNGTTWLPLSGSTRKLEYEFDTAEIIGGEQVRFRVIASSGLDNASATSQAVRIPQSPQLGLSSETLQFANLAVGGTQSLPIEIRNQGSGQLRVQIGEPSTAAFKLSSAAGFVLASGATETIFVTFEPTAAGSQQSSFTVNGRPIALRGGAFTAPVPSIDAPSGDLGQVAAGATKTSSLALRNRGTAALTISVLNVTGAGFALGDITFPRTLQPGEELAAPIRVTGGTAGSTRSGALNVTSNDPSQAQLQVALTAATVNGAIPTFTAAGVLNAASYEGGPVAPGEIIVIFGAGLGPDAIATLRLEASGSVAKELAGTRVLFDSVPAALVYTLAGQLSAIVPYSVSGKRFTQVVVEYNGRQSDPIKLPVASAAPALFSANASGTGPGAILNQNGTLNSAQNPAAPGSIVVVFGTGEGSTNPPVADGSVAASVFPASRQSVSATIGGQEARVLYGGAAPGLVAGVIQANIEVPPNAPGGAQPVVLTVGTEESQAGLTVAIAGNTSQPTIEVTPAVLNFQSVTVGQTRDLTLTIRNTGTASLTVSSIASSNARFTVTQPGTPFTVAAGASQTATIRFTPNAAGAQSGTLTVNSNDPAAAARTVAVTGTGVAVAQNPAISLDVTSLDFGSVAAGQTRELTVVVRNTGNATLTVNSIGSNNARFALAQPATPFNVGAGSFQNAVIRFSPTAAGVQNGVLTFASNDPANPSRTVTVTGTGTGGGGNIACPPVGTNLIGNASFEQPGNAGSVTQLNAGSTTLNCWTVAAGSIDYIGTFWTASNGSFSIDMDGTSPGTLTQTFATTPGSSYTVAFDMAGNPNSAPAVKQLRVSAAGQSSTRTFDTTGRSVGNMGWTRQTFTFTATAATTTLEFASLSAGGSAGGAAIDDICVEAGAQGCGTGGGGGGETPITLASALGIPNRTADNVPAQAIDGNLATFTWTTPSFNSQQPSYLAVGLSAPTSVSRLRMYKDNDNGGPGFFPKNLLIQYTTSDPSIPLGSRVWQNVSGLTNGFNGTELLTATAVNADGTVLADNHVSQTSGWASLTFNAVTVTGIRVGFSSVTPICCIHYRVYELQLYGSGGTGGGGGVPEGQIPIAPNTTAPGTLTTSSARSTGCPNCFANVYRLTVDTPQFIVIRLNSTAFDAYLQVLDLSGNILAADDDGNGGTNARISGTFQPGTYLIEATTALEGQTGAYVLALNPN